MRQENATNITILSTVNILRNILATLFLLINIPCALLLLVAAYAEYISPTWIAYPAMLGLAFPVILLANALFLLVWGVLHSRYILVPIITLLLCAPAIWKYSPIHFDHYIEDNHPGFTLLTYNAFYFNDVERTKNPDGTYPDYNRTLQTILNADADIAVIQEAIYLDKSWRHRSEEQLRQLHRQYPYHAQSKRDFILSKYPIKQVEKIKFTATASTSIYRAEIGDSILTIFNTHLESIGLTDNDKSTYREITSTPDSIKDNIGNIKTIARKLLNAFEARAQQVHYIDSLAQSIGGNIIICGDMNDTPNSYTYRILKNNRNDAYLDHGSGPGYTYQTDRMWVRIDHIFYEGNLYARYIEKIDQRSSDHDPLLVRFDWK